MARNREYITNDLSILQSRDFDVVELAPQHTAIAEVLGKDFSWTVRLSQCLPLGLRGTTHAQARRALIVLLAAQRLDFLSALPAMIARNFSVLENAGDHDFLKSALVPFVDEVMVFLGGFPCDSSLLSINSSIFDPACSPGRRLKLEQSAKQTFEAAINEFPDASEQEINRRISAVVMGHDALLGSLAMSLKAHFDAQLGKALSGSKFPREPLGTGVPYVWRQKVDDQSGKLANLELGDIVELRLDRYADAPPRERMNMFGSGAHVCPGRALALKIFEGVSQYIGKMDTKLTACSLTIDKRHVLNLPTRMTLSVFK